MVLSHSNVRAVEGAVAVCVARKAVVCRVIAILCERKGRHDNRNCFVDNADLWICVWSAWAAALIDVLVVVDASGLAL